MAEEDYGINVDVKPPEKSAVFGLSGMKLSALCKSVYILRPLSGLVLMLEFVLFSSGWWK